MVAILDIQNNHLNFIYQLINQKKTHTTGFEPVRGDPNGFQVHLLNHSDKCAYIYIYIYLFVFK